MKKRTQNSIKKVYLWLVLLCLAYSSYSQEKPSMYEKDFLQYWQIVKDNYAYFDSQKTNWDKVKALYLPKAKNIKNRAYFVRLLEQCNDELYNGHISLNTNLSNSTYIMPSGTDVWAKKVGNRFIIESVRAHSVAEQIGLRSGMEIVKFNDEPVQKGMQRYLPRSFKTYNNKVYNHVLNLYLGGTRNAPKKITVNIDGKLKDFVFDTQLYQANYYEKSTISVQKLKGNIGYVKFNNSVGNYKTIAAFDKAIDTLMNTKALVLDLRETASGGNNTVIKGIMGRLIEEAKPYQKYQFVSEERQTGVPNQWVEWVVPRKKYYKQPVIVWVGRWTGSAGEAMAIGLDGMQRATIIGTPMAGLLGAVNGFRLQETQINLQIPVTKLYHVNGTPREDFIPKTVANTTKVYKLETYKLLER